MDVEKFRDKYLTAANRPLTKKTAKTLAPWPGEQAAGGGGAQAAYKMWLQQQAHRASLQTRKVAKIDPNQVIQDLEAEQRFDRRTTATGRRTASRQDESISTAGTGRLDIRCELNEETGTKEVFSYDAERGYSKPYVAPTGPDRVDVPKAAAGKLRGRRHGLFQQGDCFYDADGEFLYRVPGAGE
jgi:hypothetical protein